MNQVITEEMMIRLLYNELEPQQADQTRAAIEADWTLKEKFEMFKASKTGLDGVQLEPKKSTIDSILSYAEQESLVK